MADEKLDIDLDPKKVLDALKDLGDGVKKLADDIESGLGKDAAKSVGKLEDAAEKGTNKITAMFRNLGTRVKEDLKTAFDATGVLAGAKFAKDLASGVQQVFDMERAFDRLNTRLGLTADKMEKFKNQVGRKVSGTGQKLEDILPGVETAAAKGGVKSPEQLANIAEMLGQAKATTGEGTEGLADTVVEILKNQGEKVTAASFKKTLDALQGTRVAGAFHTADEAGAAIKNLSGTISPEQARKMGLGTREMGGLAAMASRGGPQGEEILKKILETATKAGGKQQLNEIFGQQLFKNGKMDAGAFGKIDQKRFGQFSEQVLGSATGANQADLARFLDSMKSGMGDFKKVTEGANETASQFGVATDNLASKVDKFKESLKEAGREVGEGLSQMGHDLLKGDFSKLGGDVKKVGKALYENKGTVAAGLGITAGVGLLAGGSLNRLMSKVPGLGGMASKVAGAQAAKAMGIQQVYVVNLDQISSGGLGGGLPGKMGKAASMASSALSVAAAGAIGVEIGNALMEIPAFKKAMGSATDYVYDKIHGSDAEDASGGMNAQNEKLRTQFNEKNKTNLTAEEFAKAVENGTLAAHKQAKAKTTYTNPSAVQPRGGGM